MGRQVHATRWLYGCVAVSCFGVASAQPTELAARVDKAVAEIRSSRSAEDAQEARQALESIIVDPSFNQLDRSQKDRALSFASMAAAGVRDYEHAHQLALRLIELDGAAPKNWLLRFDYALRAGYIEDALVSLTRLVEQWPQDASRVPSSEVYQAVTAASRLPNSNAKLRLLSAMFELKARRRFAGEPSELWREFALVLLERGELSKARDVVARITAPGTLVRARSDRRFDPLLATNPDLFDVAAAAALELERLEAEVRSAPDYIEPILNLSTGLEASNRCDDALKIVEEAIARASGPTAEEQPFRDVSRNLTWLLDHRSTILRCLGRMDEALQRQIRAARLTENGRSNTNQALNLAHLMLDMDRPKDAIEVLDAVGPMSGYGKMVEQWGRLRVAVALDDDAGAEAALAYMSDHRKDSMRPYQSALLKLGQDDAAAAVLIERLEDLSTRVEVLETYQRYGERADESDDDASTGLLARADVRAALDRVGRIESYPYLRSSGWLGY